MNENFIIASRKKLTFSTPMGSLSVNDLWDLPLESNRDNVVTLDTIAVGLNKQIQDAGTVSFVKKSTKANDILKVKFDIVLHVIETLQAEADAALVIESNKAKKQRILELLEKKADEALSEKSEEELRELAVSL